MNFRGFFAIFAILNFFFISLLLISLWLLFFGLFFNFFLRISIAFIFFRFLFIFWLAFFKKFSFLSVQNSKYSSFDSLPINLVSSSLRVPNDWFCLLSMVFLAIFLLRILASVLKNVAGTRILCKEKNTLLVLSGFS